VSVLGLRPQVGQYLKGGGSDILVDVLEYLLEKLVVLCVETSLLAMWSCSLVM
jgi:hypothetical protein